MTRCTVVGLLHQGKFTLKGLVWLPVRPGSTVHVSCARWGGTGSGIHWSPKRPLTELPSTLQVRLVMYGFCRKCQAQSPMLPQRVLALVHECHSHCMAPYCPHQVTPPPTLSRPLPLLLPFSLPPPIHKVVLRCKEAPRELLYLDLSDSVAPPPPPPSHHLTHTQDLTLPCVRQHHLQLHHVSALMFLTLPLSPPLRLLFAGSDTVLHQAAAAGVTPHCSPHFPHSLAPCQSLSTVGPRQQQWWQQWRTAAAFWGRRITTNPPPPPVLLPLPPLAVHRN